MKLKDRKQKILEAIVKDYINTAEPVGSRTLSKRYDLGISPATIRNEMSDLEELGFLAQPHTSSGRIPTQKAYRYYVDEIMQIQKLAKVLRNDIHRGYLDYSREIDNTMHHTAEVLSSLTNYTSVVLAPRVSRFNCKHVQIIPLIRERVLMIVVTVEGIAKNIEMTLSREIDTGEALKLSNVLNSILKNIAFQEMGTELIDEIQELNEEEGVLLREIMPILREELLAEASNVHAGGLTNLFSYPEFNNVDRIKNLVNIIEEKPLLANVLSQQNGQQKALRVTIGEENSDENMKEFSVITTTYEVDGHPLGAFGVIGPTRMNYDKVSSVLETIRNELNSNITKLLTE
ncbi:MAG: heat-inducible transcriptional repressor HrcA [Eubacterium aggregans]|uniref:Heat-inducible transcription repressor HrcA n=1 Tax=Eubacterium aggregans TaxID=81409 RepID=A0A1H4A3N0_9FIRM|nr:heat-inducible transcriptional repressor HrcA [Eubacterium aggregans]MEA5074277.1 heat-inducible transcriptional repressor HrcA [Eubacterium aggregans]SEA30480.1 heat-inducible transcription repressor HrcA [Eubacterium aggregans]